MIQNLGWLAGFFFLVSPGAIAMPGQIVIIRHAEKPKRGDELNERGWERARAIPKLFSTHPVLSRLGPPVAIYAAEPTDNRTSIRMIQTMTPLSDALKIPIIQRFHRSQYKKILEDIRSNRNYDQKTVVICWPSDTLPKLAKALGLRDGPKSWRKKDYDRAWVLHYSGNEVTRFQNLPQKLLPGDSDT